MAKIKNKDTKPEMIIRSLIYSMDFRYRLHLKDLPGKPDIVFRSKKKVIFVHGCFWHQHGCSHYRMPKTRLIFWNRKLINNKEHDKRTIEKLRKMGWKTMIVWECQIKRVAIIKNRIRKFLE